MDTRQGLLHGEPIWKCFHEEANSDKKILQTLAQRAADVSRLTITNKPQLPPSGDPHDYYSLGIYWWPDPTSPNGEPYIRKDGEVNPKTAKFDKVRLETFVGAVSALVLFGEISGRTSFFSHAAALVRAWFLDSTTRMNPHLEYAQAIPGICTGRGTGIIDTVPLCFLLDMLLRLQARRFGNELPALKEWCGRYLDWLMESEHGRDEEIQEGNHGTWYDAQVVCLAYFCGRLDVARRQIETRTLMRIPLQIEADGTQPHELSRTLSLSYSTFNLLAFACLARVAERFSIDLWRTKVEGRTLQSALEFLVPFYSGEKTWEHPQIKPARRAPSTAMLSLVWQATGEDELLQIANAKKEHSWQLLTLVDLPSDFSPFQ